MMEEREPDPYDIRDHEEADARVRLRYPGQHLCEVPTCLVMLSADRPLCRYHARKRSERE